MENFKFHVIQRKRSFYRVTFLKSHNANNSFISLQKILVLNDLFIMENLSKICKRDLIRFLK